MNRLLTSAGTVLAAAAFAFGLAPSAGAAMTTADPVAANVTHVQLPTNMSQNPCNDDYCVLPSPSTPRVPYREPRNRKANKLGWECHKEVINNSGVPNDPDYAYGQHTEVVCKRVPRY